MFVNLGSITNKGQEIAIASNIITTKKFSLAARLTATTLSSHIVTLGTVNGEDVPPIIFNRGAQAHRTGYPAGAFFGTPITYNDADGNGQLTRAEVRVDSSRFIRDAEGNSLGFAYFGPPQPTHTQGLSFDISLLGGFRISTLFERRAGNKQLNYTTYFRCRTQNGYPGYSECDALSNPNASLSSQAAFIASQYSEFGATPSGYIEDAKFVKWRELSVRYEVPQAFARRYLRVRNGLAFSFAGRNLRKWTPYTGIDPEVNEQGGQSLFAQNEFNTQPQVSYLHVPYRRSTLSVAHLYASSPVSETRVRAPRPCHRRACGARGRLQHRLDCHSQ